MPMLVPMLLHRTAPHDAALRCGREAVIWLRCGESRGGSTVLVVRACSV